MSSPTRRLPFATRTASFARTAVLGLTVALAAPGLRAETLKVPVPFATIQEAVDAADPGDVIVVRKGTYGPVVIDGLNDLTLKGQGRPTIVVEGEIDDGGSHGIEVSASNDIVVKGFAVTGSGSTGISVASSNDVLVQACRVEDLLGGDGYAAQSSNQVTFSKVHARNVGGDGVRVSSASDVTVERARLQDLGGGGVDVASSTGVTVTGTRISDTEDEGVHASSGGGDSDLTVERTRIADAGDRGVHVSNGGGTHTVTVERSRISDSGDDGVQSSGSGTLVTLIAVRIDRSGNHGVDHGGHDLTTSRLTVKTAANQGVRVRPVGQTGPGEEGLSGFDPAAVSMTTTKISGTGSNGLHLEADGAQVEHLVIKGTGQNALQIAQCTGAQVLLARVSGTTSTGVHFNFAQGCTLELAKVSKCDNGIRLDLNSADNTILQAKVTRPKFFGLRVFGDGNTITGSAVARAGDTGVEVSGSGNTFQDNKATGSANLDHHDLAGKGANAYIDNVFGTSQIDA